ncbi:MAG: 50S ribosomal protein L21e [Candidatus Bathyarchaeia archaeon]
MVERSKGYRSRTRNLLRKRPRDKGKINLSKILRTYKNGDKVCIKIDPSVHKGMPHRRYHGKIGLVIGKRGRSSEVKVISGDKSKILLVRPEHLEAYGGL